MKIPEKLVLKRVDLSTVENDTLCLIMDTEGCYFKGRWNKRVEMFKSDANTFCDILDVLAAYELPTSFPPK